MNLNIDDPLKGRIRTLIKILLPLILVIYPVLAIQSFGESDSIVGPDGFYILIRILMDGTLNATIYIFQAVLIGLLLKLLTSDTIKFNKSILSYLKLAIFYLYPITVMVSAFKYLPNKAIPWNELIQILCHSNWINWMQNITPLVIFLIIYLLYLLPPKKDSKRNSN